jgi:hypothetical protein
VEFAKGVATGFVMGVAIIGAVVATLYVHDDAAHERNSARIEQVDAKVQRLERALTTLSVRVSGETPPTIVPLATQTAVTADSATPRAADRIP